MHIGMDAYSKEVGKHLVVHRCCPAKVIMKMTFFAMNGTQRAAGEEVTTGDRRGYPALRLSRHTHIHHRPPHRAR